MPVGVRGWCKAGLIAIFLIVIIKVMVFNSDIDIYRLTEFGQSTQVSRGDVLAPKNKLALVEDLPVRYLRPDGVKLDPKIFKIYKSNHRTKGQSSWNYMESRRLTDDYRFCVKTAKFLGPIKYKENIKNPCWMNEKKELYCVPYFYLIGVSKSGTTDMYQRIIHHPDVFYDSNLKEKHYFDYKRYLDGKKDSVYYYAQFFDKFSGEVKGQLETTGRSNMITGDGTPCYFFYSFYWHCYEGNEGLTEPRYTNADVIHNLYPGSKIILSLRDPVTRLYSRFNTMYSRHVRHNTNITLEMTAKIYHQKVSRAIEIYQQCFQQWSPRHCAYNGTLYVQTGLRIQEGMYSIYLKDWLKVFPRDQLFVFRFEDYVKNSTVYKNKIYEFLGLEPVIGANGGGRRNAHKKKERVLEETTDVLRKFYAPFILDLQKILGSKDWTWGYDHYATGSTSTSLRL